MKKIILCFWFCFFCSTIHAAPAPDKEPVYIKIVDQYSQPIAGVYVIHQAKNHLITTTDVYGDCSIHLEQFPEHDSIQFQGIGYVTTTCCIADLYSVREIKLSELYFELPESIIKGITTQELLAKASANPKALFLFAGILEKRNMKRSRSAGIQLPNIAANMVIISLQGI